LALADDCVEVPADGVPDADEDDEDPEDLVDDDVDGEDRIAVCELVASGPDVEVL
jgi:hypothetical protein